MDDRERKEKGERVASIVRTPVSEAFRETLLCILDAEEAEAFRRFGDVVQDRLLDRAAYEKRNPHFSFTVAEMVGVAADLRFLEAFLRAVGAERRLSDLTPTEQGLSSFAQQLAPQVAALAEKLDREIERWVLDDEDEPSEPSEP